LYRNHSICLLLPNTIPHHQHTHSKNSGPITTLRSRSQPLDNYPHTGVQYTIYMRQSWSSKILHCNSPAADWRACDQPDLQCRSIFYENYLSTRQDIASFLHDSHL
jgi:hypothetical protein